MATSATSLLTSPSATASAPAATPSGQRAPSQGGVLDGANPTVYHPKDPITLFIIQAGLIIIVCHILHWPLSKIRQPRVIAEVIGGILLGPSVMGRIPGFRETIFPEPSLANLTLVATLGLVLYLFLIGLETDVRFLVQNWRIAASVAFGGLALPFGLGCALAWGLYHQFSSDEGIESIGFGVYMLFIGVAIAITAFPVLCRILTELKLLDTTVGIVTLSAGVANDVVGWILLALCVALVNASSGLTALWILLCCIGYMLLLLYAIKPCLMWLLRRAGSIENGPSQSIIALILLLALTSAFFTGIIGVHAIFGGFMVGLIIPREGGFNIKVTEKLEDLIGAIFLPLYFTLSGLNTNLGLLDTGMAWAYVIAITVVAFVSKVIGASLAAKSNGLVWRESFTIGILMSCKGLVELIVLNIGLQARILSQRTFTIFVVMALLTTFATTPIASALYPPWYQKKLAAWKRGEIDWDTGEPIEGSDGPGEPGNVTGDRIRRLFVYLRLDNMPAILGLVSLFGLPPNSESRAPPADNAEGGKEKDAAALVSAGGVRAVRVHGIRLIQLTDRDSSVMTVSQVDEYSHFDPVVNIFRSLGQFSRLAVSGEVAVMPESRFSETIVTRSSDMSSDLTLIPWSETGSMGDAQVLSSEVVNKKLTLPYINFVKSVLDDSERNVAVFFNGYDAVLADSERPDLPKLTRAYSFSDRHRDIPNAAVTTMAHHFFLPYFGGIDDRLALTIVLQLCEKPDVTATVIQMPGSDEGHDDYFALASSKVPSSVASRVSFETETVENDAEAVLARAMSEFEASSRETARQNLVVLGRRSNHKEPDGKAPVSVVDEITECLGATAGHLIAAKAKVGLLVVQAKASRD